MRKSTRRGAITIEYLIFSIVVLGIGACLLSFQGEIENSIITTQSSFEGLQENLLASESQECRHEWEYLDNRRYANRSVSFRQTEEIPFPPECRSCKKCGTSENHLYLVTYDNGETEIDNRERHKIWYEYHSDKKVVKTECQNCGLVFV
jgi:hypothetical protein